jgi:hypothetical protein
LPSLFYFIFSLKKLLTVAACFGLAMHWVEWRYLKLVLQQEKIALKINFNNSPRLRIFNYDPTILAHFVKLIYPQLLLKLR